MLLPTKGESVAHGVLNRPTRTKLSRQQITGFWGAWAGWNLDGMDPVIYALVPKSCTHGTASEVWLHAGRITARLALREWCYQPRRENLALHFPAGSSLGEGQ